MELYGVALYVLALQPWPESSVVMSEFIDGSDKFGLYELGVKADCQHRFTDEQI